MTGPEAGVEPGNAPADAGAPADADGPAGEGDSAGAGDPAGTNDPEAHLLVVDDDERIRTLLRRYLQRHGFLASVARDAAHARRVLAGLDFDLIVVDVMMPGEDGVSLTRWLRETRATPVLLLTAKAEADDRIAGLEAGADDYLAKPFEPRELLLRIAAILRRAPAGQDEGPHHIALGPVRYDATRGEMWRAGADGPAPVHLTGTEAELMRAFAARPGEPLSRADLTAALGKEAESQERAVDVQITRLRRKIEDDPRRPRYLQTVRGAGYMLVPD